MTPGKAGLARIGAEKCKLCHKLQYTSWADSGHARRKPALDCESCHGPGSEYKSLAVMKDPAKAKAAGLVEPGAAFCGKCHTGAGSRSPREGPRAQGRPVALRRRPDGRSPGPSAARRKKAARRRPDLVGGAPAAIRTRDL
ncbi:MAG: hypothetical protein IPN03_17235 [Holophagales bacterium]|nr:hypothetical protein [Holophagales bacterium]